MLNLEHTLETASFTPKTPKFQSWFWSNETNNLFDRSQYRPHETSIVISLTKRGNTRPKLSSYRNQPINLQGKSIDCYVYDCNFGH